MLHQTNMSREPTAKLELYAKLIRAELKARKAAKARPEPEAHGEVCQTDPCDPRCLENTKAHVQIALPARDRWTPAQAAKARRMSYEACGCRLCALALNPPKTFAEVEKFMPTDLAAHRGVWQPKEGPQHGPATLAQIDYLERLADLGSVVAASNSTQRRVDYDTGMAWAPLRRYVEAWEDAAKARAA